MAPAIDSADQFALDLLARIQSTYGGYTAAQFSGLTHASGSLWTVTRDCNPGLKRVVIPNEVIRSHFAERVRHKTSGEMARPWRREFQDGRSGRR